MLDMSALVTGSGFDRQAFWRSVRDNSHLFARITGSLERVAAVECRGFES